MANNSDNPAGIDTKALEYNEDGWPICPRCGKHVNLGKIGMSILTKVHYGTPTCDKIMKKREDAKKRDQDEKKKADKMRSWFGLGTKKKAALVPTTTQSPTVIHAAPPPAKTTTVLHPASETLPPPPPPNPPTNPTSPWDELLDLAARLPEPIDRSSNYLAEFDALPASYDIPGMDNDELWEESLNSVLHRAFGWGDELGKETVAGLQPERLRGLVRFLDYFVRVRGMSGGLFEGRVNRVIEGVKRWGNLQASALGPVALSAVAPSNIPAGNVPNNTEVIDVPSDTEHEIPGPQQTVRTPPSPPRSEAHPRCSGHKLETPPGVSPYAIYPFKLHDEKDLPWNVMLHNGTMILFSKSCEETVGPGVAKCRFCERLGRNGILQGIVRRMHDGVLEGTSYAYLGMDALQQALRLKAKRVEFHRLRGLNQARKLSTKARALDSHTRFLSAVASKKVERVDRIIRLGLRHGRGIRSLLAQCLKAADGLYKPKDYLEEDYMRGMLLWKLGGNRIASIAHRALGLPSITTLKNQTRIPPIHLSPGMPTVAEVSENVQNSFAGMEELMKPEPGAKNQHAVLMFDELAVEKRLRWDLRTNCIVGVCREHAHTVPLEFKTEKDMKEVHHAIEEDRAHYAGEATIGAVGLLCPDNRKYAARSVLVSGDCKRETGEQHAKVIQTVIDGVNDQKPLTNTRIVSIASDGETRRGSAMVSLTFKKRLSPDSDIYNQLSPLPFMNDYVGDDDITGDKDYKHVFKRLRNLLLRDSGIVVGGVRITPAVLRAHLQAEKVSADHIRSILNPEDKQDVRLAFDLLKAVSSLPRTTENTNPSFVKAREAIWIFGQLLHHLLLPYICVELDLDEQLEHLSAATHLAMFLYHTSGKECLPTLLYADIMIMVKNAYFCVAKAKVDNPDGSFSLILLGTDRLEELFGNLRTMIGNDSNLDILQASWRLAGTAEVANILAKYPQWDRPPRRLKIPAVNRNMEPLPASIDHLKPGSWVGSQKVKDVTLQTSWSRGRRLIEKTIPGAAKDFLDLEALNAASSDVSYDILSPHGKLLVTLVPEQGVDAHEEEDLDMAPGNEAPDPVPILEPTEAEIDPEAPAPAEDARVQVEDAIGEIEVEEDEVSGDQPAAIRHEKHIMVDGKPMAKSRALSLYGRFRSLATSRDRLKRVQHMERYTARSALSETTHIVDPDSDAPSLVIHDPVASVLWSDNRLWLCIGEVVSIKVDGRAVDEVSHEMMVEDTVRVSFQLCGLRPATVEEDPEEEFDWRTYSVPEATFTVPGRYLDAISPTPASTVSQPSSMYYLLDSTFLIALTASILSKLSLDDLKTVSKITASSQFPYREKTGKLCFLAEDERQLDEIVGASTVQCELCDPSPTFDISQSKKILQHMASHILKDPKLKRSDELCGLCLRPFPLCEYYLKKGKGADASLTIDRTRSKCKYAIRFNPNTAGKTSITSPCSNSPLVCPLCPKKSPAVWKYNLHAHFARAHPMQVKNATFMDLWSISKTEVYEMEKVWKARKSIPARRANPSGLATIAVSEMHKSSSAQSIVPAENDEESSMAALGPGDDSDFSCTADSQSDYESPAPSQRGSLERELEDEGFWDVDVAIPHAETCDEPGAVKSDVVISGPTDGLRAPSMALTMTSVSAEVLPAIPPISPIALTPPIATSPPIASESEAAAMEVAPVEEIPVAGLRPRRVAKRKVLVGASSECTECGLVAEPGHLESIMCCAIGCETVWYHLACVGYDRAPAKWECETCARSKGTSRAKRPKRAK
ncbi:hypothetical protein DFP72DRAFT_1076427 [Ephemerocybe angulata]|uniref:PHD-type domain-containing protein n=1 Tax=Ephemerocybe angulata TaxID=980116 RepID=A0A8H6LY71_9AGAR|nr:hypothetical protein DFP72DRAFT_1076427 [Tulosesus angulatus]